jgi:hypothetical protein
MKLVPRSKLDEEPLLRELGPEPLGNAFDAAMLANACQGKNTSLKAALLDQTVVAGLGNIYVCEAFSRALLSPKRKASTIADRRGAPNERAQRLVEAIKTVLNDAIAAGGSSLRDHRRTDGSLGDFQHNFRVYDREGKPCPTRGCPGTIKRIVQNGRSTFFCPVCQKCRSVCHLATMLSLNDRFDSRISWRVFPLSGQISARFRIRCRSRAARRCFSTRRVSSPPHSVRSQMDCRFSRSDVTWFGTSVFSNPHREPILKDRA